MLPQQTPVVLHRRFHPCEDQHVFRPEGASHSRNSSYCASYVASDFRSSGFSTVKSDCGPRSSVAPVRYVVVGGSSKPATSSRSVQHVPAPSVHYAGTRLPVATSPSGTSPAGGFSCPASVLGPAFSNGFADLSVLRTSTQLPSPEPLRMRTPAVQWRPTPPIAREFASQILFGNGSPTYNQPRFLSSADGHYLSSNSGSGFLCSGESQSPVTRVSPPQRSVSKKGSSSGTPRSKHHAVDKTASMSLCDSAALRRSQNDSNTSTRASPRISSTRTRIGFPNRGNTCFYNAVLQGLLGFNEFVSLFMNRRTPLQQNGASRYKGKLLQAWLKLLEAVFSETRENSGGGGASGSTTEFEQAYTEVLDLIMRRNPQIIRGQQNDAHEMFHALMAAIGEEIAVDAAPKQQLISSLTPDAALKHSLSDFRPAAMFKALLTTRMKCAACASTKYKSEYQLDWQVEIPKRPAATPPMNLEELLTYTFEMRETLSVECEKCRTKHSPTEVVRYPTKLPSVYLCIQFKRFGWDSTAGKSYRVNTPISLQLPHTIDLKKYQKSSSPELFDVIGVTLQTGSTLEAGHYTSIQYIYDQWYTISDDHYELYNTTDKIDPSSIYIVWLRRRFPIAF